MPFRWSYPIVLFLGLFLICIQLHGTVIGRTFHVGIHVSFPQYNPTPLFSYLFYILDFIFNRSCFEFNCIVQLVTCILVVFELLFAEPVLFHFIPFSSLLCIISIVIYSRFLNFVWVKIFIFFFYL